MEYLKIKLILFFSASNASFCQIIGILATNSSPEIEVYEQNSTTYPNRPTFLMELVHRNPADCTYETEFNVNVKLYCFYYNLTNGCPQDGRTFCTTEMLNGIYKGEPTNVRIKIQEELAFFRFQRESIFRARFPYIPNEMARRETDRAFFTFPKIERKFFGSMFVQIEYDCESEMMPNQYCHNKLEEKLAGFGKCIWNNYKLVGSQTMTSKAKCPNWLASLNTSF